MPVDDFESRKRDIKLIERLKAGDVIAFNEIYGVYKPFVMHICLRLVRNSAISEELTQDVFQKLLENIGKIDGSTLKSWLRTVTFNCVVNHFNHYSKEAHVVSDSYELGNIHRKREKDTFRDVIDREKFQKVHEAIDSIEDDIIRKCAEAKYIWGFSHEEIAVSISISNQKVAEYLFKARRILEEWLKKYLL